jgi:hypothetical protein
MTSLARLALGLAGSLAINAIIRQASSIPFRDRVMVIPRGFGAATRLH